MFKRRDWLHTHGADGGGSSDDDSSSSSEPDEGDTTSSDSGDGSSQKGSELSGEERGPGCTQSPGVPDGGEGESSDGDERAGLGTSGAAAAGSSGGDDDDDPLLLRRRLEDISEDELEEGDDAAGEESTEQLAMQLKNWAEAPPPKIVKGAPVRCVLCSGALVLNGTVLRQHIASKKHLRRVAAAAAGGHTDLQLHEVFCFAGDYASGSEDEEGGETWQERMDRLDRGIAEAKGKAAEAAAREEAKRSKGSKRARAGPRKKAAPPAERKRPGKRQRQALREAGGGKPPGAGDTPVGLKKPSKVRGGP